MLLKQHCSITLATAQQGKSDFQSKANLVKLHVRLHTEFGPIVAAAELSKKRGEERERAVVDSPSIRFIKVGSDQIELV